MVTIKQANVTVMVNDMDRAIRFYTETLSLKLKAHYGNQFAQVEAPGTIVALHPVSKAWPRAGNSESLSIGFVVDSLEKTMSELKAKGVSFSHLTNDAQVRLAFFADPDGNPLYLSQNKWG